MMIPKNLHYLTISLVFTVGCATTVKKAATDATSQVVDTGLVSITEPQNRDKLDNLISDAITRGDDPVIDSILERLAQPSNEKNLRRVVHTIGTQIVADLAAAPPPVQRQIDAAASRAMQIAMRSAVTELRAALPDLVAAVMSNPEVRESIAPISREAGQGAAKGVGDSVVGKD